MFRNGEKGTGYYHDSAVKPEEVRGQEHDELGKPTGNDTELPGTTRCTRARNAAGIRIRKKNRRKIAGGAPSTVSISAETVLKSDRWWTSYGWWAVDSANANAWSTAKDKILALVG